MLSIARDAGALRIRAVCYVLHVIAVVPHIYLYCNLFRTCSIYKTPGTSFLHVILKNTGNRLTWMQVTEYIELGIVIMVILMKGAFICMMSL